MGNEEKVYVVKEAAIRLDRSVNAVRALLKKGKLKRLPCGDSRVQISEGECVRFLSGAPVRLVTSALRA